MALSRLGNHLCEVHAYNEQKEKHKQKDHASLRVQREKIREGDKVVLFQIIQRQLILGGLHDNGGKDLRRAACDNKAPSCTRNSGQKSGKFHKETESNHKANQADTMHVCNAFP